MTANAALYGFSAEYRGGRRVYDGFEPITRMWRWRP
jgi:hypothetical protein